MSKSTVSRPRTSGSAATMTLSPNVIHLDEPRERPSFGRQADENDLGMRWAMAWYEGMESYRRRKGHVAA